MSREPEIDVTATAELVVGSNHLASSISTDGGDSFPAVLATARMIALMETAAARVLQPFLGPGELSVGVTVEIIHSAPTPPGVLVTANARYTGREGKLFVFEINAHDEGGEVGRGSHKRAIVQTERLVRAAAKRNARQ